MSPTRDISADDLGNFHEEIERALKESKSQEDVISMGKFMQRLEKEKLKISLDRMVLALLMKEETVWWNEQN